MNAQYFPSSMFVATKRYRISWLPMKWASIHPRSPGFFPFGEGGEGAGFFEFFFLFLLCSHRKCPMCSPTCVQYTWHQCYPLGTYIGRQLLGPMCLYVWSEYFYTVDSWKFQFFFVMGQLKRLLAKKQFWTWKLTPK
jgi:hypothetical protein